MFYLFLLIHSKGRVEINLRQRIVEHELCDVVTNSSRACDTSLVYVERESFTWKRVAATTILNTLESREIRLNQKEADKFMKISNGITWFYDARESVWIPAEEAVANSLVTVKRIINEPHFDKHQKSLTVHQVIGVQPGSRSNANWITPNEAAELGLFNWQTGEVTTAESPFAEVKGWCSFKEAREKGYIQMTAGCDSHWWSSLVPINIPTRRILSSQVHLVANKRECSNNQ